ncbi:MAG: Lysophospholipase, partial [uncultured Nocardioidaceae bacterium]
ERPGRDGGPSRRAVLCADSAPARRRRGGGRRNAGLPSLRAADLARGAPPARVRRLLLPDTCGRVLGVPGLRLLRPRPAQARTVDPPAPDPELRHRPGRVLRGDRRGRAAGSRAGRARPSRAQRTLHRRAGGRAVGARAPAPARGDGAQLPVARPERRPSRAHCGHPTARPGRGAPALPGRPAHRVRPLRPEPAPRPPRRVGLRPGLETARELAGVRRLAAGRAPRPRRDPPGCRRRRTGSGADLCAELLTHCLGREHHRARHRPRRGADPAMGTPAGRAGEPGEPRRGGARRHLVGRTGAGGGVPRGGALARGLRRPV